MTQVKNLINKVAIALLGLVMLSGLAAVPALAQDSNATIGQDTVGGTIDPCVYSGTCDAAESGDNEGIGGLLATIFTVVQYAIWAVGAVAVLFLIYGGFLFIVDPGGSGAGAEKGKQVIFNALIGLVVVLLATAIVQLVSQIVGGLDIN